MRITQTLRTFALSRGLGTDRIRRRNEAARNGRWLLNRSFVAFLALSLMAGFAGLTNTQSASAVEADHVIVSFSFDDAWATQYGALSVFGRHGMHATLYVNSGYVGTKNNPDRPGAQIMTWSQLHEFAAAGHEIAGHTAHHTGLTEVSESTARAEIQADIDAFQAQGFPRPVSFAYPYGYWGPDEERYVREAGYASARTTDVFTRESNPPRDPYALRIIRASMDGSEGLAALQRDVTTAEAAPGKSWLIYFMHDFYSPIDEQIDGFLQWLQPRSANGTVVKTMREVVSPGGNQPPLANAGPDQTVSPGAAVQLDGSGSTDPDANPLTYQWTQTSGTPVTLSSSTAAKPTFTAPSTAGALTFQLVVNDGTVNSSPDTVAITVSGGSNQAPTANAGPDQAVFTGSTGQLDGSASSDPDGNPLTFNWTQTGGTPVTLSSSTAAKPTFTAPSTAGTLTFQLVVNDGQLNSSPDTVAITVQAQSVGPTYRSSSSTGNDTLVSAVNIPVPAGAAAGDVIVAAVSTWGTSAPAVSAPTGFTLRASYTGATANGGADTTRIYWKRLTAADTGSYRFSWSGSRRSAGHAVAVSGAAASGDPLEAVSLADSGSATTFPTASLTTAGVSLLTWLGRNVQPAAGTHTPPTGFTEVQDKDSTTVAYQRVGSGGTYSATGGSYLGPAGPIQSILIGVRA